MKRAFIFLFLLGCQTAQITRVHQEGTDWYLVTCVDKPRTGYGFLEVPTYQANYVFDGGCVNLEASHLCRYQYKVGTRIYYQDTSISGQVSKQSAFISCIE